MSAPERIFAWRRDEMISRDHVRMHFNWRGKMGPDDKCDGAMEYVRADLALSPDELRQVREALTVSVTHLGAAQIATKSDQLWWAHGVAEKALAILTSKEPKA